MSQVTNRKSLEIHPHPSGTLQPIDGNADQELESSGAFTDPTDGKLVKPRKTFVQKHRLRVRSALLVVMLATIAFAERTLLDTPAGLVLYALGSILLFGAVIGRFWCYVYNSGARDAIVITSGPYSLCRNPIYVFSMLTAVAAGLIAQSLTHAVVFGLGTLVFYLHIIGGEEDKMSALHGQTYLDYRDRTNKLLPRFGDLSPGVIRSVPGEILIKKIPKLIRLAAIFPAIEGCNRLQTMIGSASFPVF